MHIAHNRTHALRSPQTRVIHILWIRIRLFILMQPNPSFHFDPDLASKLTDSRAVCLFECIRIRLFVSIDPDQDPKILLNTFFGQDPIEGFFVRGFGKNPF